MSPTVEIPCQMVSRFPRPRGDEPDEDITSMEVEMFSPPTRG